MEALRPARLHIDQRVNAVPLCRQLAVRFLANLELHFHAVARDLFFEPGTATERAVAMVYELLELPDAVCETAQASPRHAMRTS